MKEFVLQTNMLWKQVKDLHNTLRKKKFLWESKYKVRIGY